MSQHSEHVYKKYSNSCVAKETLFMNSSVHAKTNENKVPHSRAIKIMPTKK